VFEDWFLKLDLIAILAIKFLLAIFGFWLFQKNG